VFGRLAGPRAAACAHPPFLPSNAALIVMDHVVISNMLMGLRSSAKPSQFRLLRWRCRERKIGNALNRRELLQWLGGSMLALALLDLRRDREITSWEPVHRSMGTGFQTGFRDAKFAFGHIGGHQSRHRGRDWYARNMYMQGSTSILSCGDLLVIPPRSIQGSVDIWKAAKWDPEHL